MGEDVPGDEVEDLVDLHLLHVDVVHVLGEVVLVHGVVVLPDLVPFLDQLGLVLRRHLQPFECLELDGGRVGHVLDQDFKDFGFYAFQPQDLKLVVLADGVEQLLGELLVGELDGVHVEEVSGDGVDAAGAHVLEALLLGDAQHEDEVGLDVHSPEQVDLHLGVGEALQHPPAHHAVALRQSLLHDVVDDRVGNELSRVDVGLDLAVQLGVALLHLLDQVDCRHLDEAEVLGNELGLRRPA
mmetsp:Transcript_15199/g.25721  ORF Transcript_15199/g.25721 Transcript_15199/m.25721 type:complete len:241 (-) Transcript_15199:792-1514(-)